MCSNTIIKTGFDLYLLSLMFTVIVTHEAGKSNKLNGSETFSALSLNSYNLSAIITKVLYAYLSWNCCASTFF